MSGQKTIGVLTPVLDGYYFGNLLKSISDKAREHGAKVVIIGTSASYYEELFASGYVDGWIVIMDAVDEPYIAALRELNKPIVGINTLLEVDYTVSNNNVGMIKEAVEHLLQHGHRRIAYAGDIHFYDAKERYGSFMETLQLYGLEAEERCFFNTLEKSPSEIVAMMLDEDLPFTGIVAVNDFFAIELMDQLKNAGISVPEQIAIIGVDDAPMAKSYRPSLTTFQLPVNEIAERAADVLLKAINGDGPLSGIAWIDAKPVYRASCGCSEHNAEEWLEESTETIQYLSNLMSRNYNLGVLMQSYKFQESKEMDWLLHTPFRKGFVGIQSRKPEGVMLQYRFMIREDDGDARAPILLSSGSAELFPPKETLHDDSFMGDDYAMIVVPVVQNGFQLGVMALVGLGDVSTQFYTFNSTFQLANFFASALQRESIHKELESYSNQLELISNMTYDGIWEINTATGAFLIRGGIHKVVGLEKDDSPKTLDEVLAILHPEDKQLVRDAFLNHLEMNKGFDIECRLMHKQGYAVWVNVTGFTQFDSSDKQIKMLGVIKNITDRKEAQERIRQLAYGDSLTGLANRHFFEQQLALLLKRANRKGTKMALLLFDLDRFKLINDSYGHQAGDRVLQFVANRVREIVRSSYLVGRLGGDEFIIAIPTVKSIESILAFGAKIVECLSEPFYDHDREYYISCSIGISIYPNHGLDSETMIKNADIAMYNAKALGRNRYQLYSADIDKSYAERLTMENKLRKSIERNELVLHYQPQLDLKTDRIYGVEALVRWNSPDYGLVSPLDFIPIAEETGIIITLGEWVLREACSLLEKLRENGLPPIMVSVNISTRQLVHSDFVNSIRRVLHDTGIDPTLLCLEITESGMLTDIEHCLSILQSLIGLGISISMDDFGTGYSSLSLLKSLPISLLKIDKSFVKDMTSSRENSEIVHTIISLSHILSIQVVAEGVETMEQIMLLQKQDIDYIQGYYISKPLSYEHLISYLQDRSPQL